MHPIFATGQVRVMCKISKGKGGGAPDDDGPFKLDVGNIAEGFIERLILIIALKAGALIWRFSRPLRARIVGLLAHSTRLGVSLVRRAGLYRSSVWLVGSTAMINIMILAGWVGVSGVPFGEVPLAAVFLPGFFYLWVGGVAAKRFFSMVR